MSAGKQPGKAIKLTNVSVVRLKKGGKRFEVRSPPFQAASWAMPSEGSTR